MRRRMTTWLGAAAFAVLTAAGTTVFAGVATGVAAPACNVTWGSLPRSDQVPVDASTLTNVRAGRHDCFDRLVMDGSSFARVEYVDQVRADGSGEVVPLRGGARLQIITNRSDGAETGNPTYEPANPRELVDVSGWTTFRQAAFAGSFEGQTTLGLGVRARLPFRVFALSSTTGPPRVVIDVAHQW